MRRLLVQGISVNEVARRTSVPVSTIKRWRHARHIRAGARPPIRWRPDEPLTYCYLLGIYLGDGHIVWGKRSGTISIALDAAYPRIVGRVQSALGQTFPGAAVRTYRHPVDRRVSVRLSSPLLGQAFPQHGPGKKHEREIALAPWQYELTSRYPEHFIRGLIHSDGCRTVNRFRTKLPSGRVASYEYPRYFFSNLAADIRGIFCEHCDLLGVCSSQSNPRNISISHCDSVALLDSFIGPKE